VDYKVIPTIKDKMNGVDTKVEFVKQLIKNNLDKKHAFFTLSPPLILNISFNFYSTPLWFGFGQGWIYAGLLAWRAYRTGRLSDGLLALLLVGMTFTIWEYMLGFSGIGVLWEELDFFPRGFGYALPPLFYFYLKSQADSRFRFGWGHAWHFAPFWLHAVYHVGVWAQGRAFVREWVQQVHDPYGIAHLEFLIEVVMYVYYFYQSLKFYRHYQAWTVQRFSDPDAVSLRWYRNVLVVLILAVVADWLQLAVDLVFQLSFEQDWWDNLLMVGLIYYMCIAGYAQVQPARDLTFTDQPEPLPPAAPGPLPGGQTAAPPPPPPDFTDWQAKLDRHLAEHRPYLEPELTLAGLAQQLKTNASVLSAAINGAYGKNFNDFINEYRVAEFKRLARDPQNGHLTLLALALECGFNSKSTFNRAFKQSTGQTPKEFLAGG
jgi:AraC-like DNA-binding protein